MRLTTLPPPRSLASYPVHLQNPLPLPQLTALLTLLNQALDIIDISRWTGDPHNGAFISGQLRLLDDTIEEAQQTLKGGEDVVGGKWWEDAMTEDVCHLAFLVSRFVQSHRVTSLPSNVYRFCSTTTSSSQRSLYLYLQFAKTFSPPVPPNLSLHLSIADAALLLHVRTLAPPSAPESSLTGLSLRTRLGLSPRPPVHDELDQVFHFRGEEVTVKEKVRVESQDPSLMAVMAKLSALGHAVASWRLKVGIVMGEDLEGDA